MLSRGKADEPQWVRLPGGQNAGLTEHVNGSLTFLKIIYEGVTYSALMIPRLSKGDNGIGMLEVEEN